MTQYFLCPNILSAKKQILNSHITWCPKITVSKKPQGGGGGGSYLAHGLNGFKTKISIKLAYQYMVIFLNFYTTSNHPHPLQVGNCDSNSRLVVDEDDNGKFRPERVKLPITSLLLSIISVYVVDMYGTSLCYFIAGSANANSVKLYRLDPQFFHRAG